MRLSRETLIKSKHSQTFNQNSCFKGGNVTFKKCVRNIGLCNMAPQMRRSAAYVYKPVVANNTLGTGGFFSLVQWDASGGEEC